MMWFLHISSYYITFTCDYYGMDAMLQMWVRGLVVRMCAWLWSSYIDGIVVCVGLHMNAQPRKKADNSMWSCCQFCNNCVRFFHHEKASFSVMFNIYNFFCPAILCLLFTILVTLWVCWVNFWTCFLSWGCHIKGLMQIKVGNEALINICLPSICYVVRVFKQAWHFSRITCVL
jgi:hypothetical protein